MNKKYVVRLSDAERELCLETIKKLKGSSEEVRRAHILLKTDGCNSDYDTLSLAGSYEEPNPGVQR